MIPKASGGRVTWENAVTACKTCNHKKGTKLWKPLRHPYKPDYYNLVAKWKNRPIHIEHESWNQYLGIEDARLANG